MDYKTKRDMIMRAYKWREDIKRKSDDEFYAQALLVFMFIISLSHLVYIYKNFDNKLQIKYLDINSSNEECSKSEQDTTP
jgi:hypothetical protein